MISVFFISFANASQNSTINVNGNVVRGTCSFLVDDQIIKLEPVKPSDFGDFSIVNPAYYTLKFACPGAKGGLAKINLTGTADENDTSAFVNTGTAENVALRVVNTNWSTLVPGGTYYYTIKDGAGTINQYAGYVATGKGPVSAGTFSSIVTYILNYY